MNDQFQIAWVDIGREPTCPPDPNYPDGIDLDVTGGAFINCLVSLPYPAKRCGYHAVRCLKCGITAAVTTAGRPDDPRSIRLPCKHG